MDQTVRLSEPAQIPEMYRDTVAQAVAQIYQRMRWHMQEQFGFYDLPLQIDPLHTMLADTLSEIARAAAGEREHSDFSDGELMECIQTVMELLFASPVSGTYTIPSEFWGTQLGGMVARAQLWLRHDELITIADAAELRGVSVQAISQAVDGGRLTAYIDPDATQRQGRRLVSKSEVEHLD
jgi:hypothetical protein